MNIKNGINAEIHIEAPSCIDIDYRQVYRKKYGIAKYNHNLNDSLYWKCGTNFLSLFSEKLNTKMNDNIS